MSKNPARPRDTNQLAKHIVELAIGEATEPAEQDEVKKAAAALGRLGGLKGGRARAEKLTPEQRHEIAKKAAAERWKKEEKEEGE